MKKIIWIITILILSFGLSSCWDKENDLNKIEKNQNIEIEQINEDIDNMKKIKEEMSKDVKDISQKLLDWEISDEEAQKAMLDSINNSTTLNSQLEKQKEEMPKMLEILKFNLECLEDADNKSEVKKCSEKSEKLAKKYWIEEMYEDEEDEEDFNWWKEEKKEVISELKDWIQMFENILPCIEKAKVMTDFMKCSQENMK